MKRQNRIITIMISMLLVCTMCFGAGAEEAGIKIDEVNFPDAVFRREILKYDLDKDLMLSESEAENIQEIRLPNCDMESLQGIEYLTELRVLDCDSNRLKTLDVSRNTQLTHLWCGSNKLSELDVSNNPELLVLYCGDNGLKTLDLSKNTKLTNLYCAGNRLTELDVSNNPELTELNFVWNNVGSIDTSNNPKLKDLAFSGNPVRKLDVSNMPDLEELFCGWSGIKELDVSNNPKLYYLSVIDAELTELDVSQNPAMRVLMVESNKLETLDISKCPDLVDLVEGKDAILGGDSGIAAEWSLDDQNWGSGTLYLDSNVKLYTGTGKYAEAKEPEIKAAADTDTEKDTEAEYTVTYPESLNDYNKSILFDFFCKWAQDDRNELPMSFIPAQRTSGEDVKALVDRLLALGTPVSYQINSERGIDGLTRVFQCTAEMACAEGEPARFVQVDLGVNGGWNGGIDVADMTAMETTGYESMGEVFSLAPEAVLPVKLAEGLRYLDTTGELLPIGVNCEAEGIRIELISGLVKDDNAWFFYSVEDLEGKYDDCTPDVSLHDFIGDVDWLSSRLLYHDVKAHKSYHLTQSHYRNKTDTNERDMNVSAGFMEFDKRGWMNLSELIAEHCEEAENVTTVPLNAWHSDYEHEGRALTDEERKILDYRKPLDIEVVPGVSVSGIGWIDGKLHVQITGKNYYRADILDNGVYTYDNGKRMIYSPLCWDAGDAFYEEYVFDYKPENVEQLKLVIEASKNTNDALNRYGRWNMQFPLSSICPDVKAEEKTETTQENTDVLPAGELQYVGSYSNSLLDYDKYTVWEFFCKWAQGDTDDMPYSFTNEQKTRGEETQQKVNELLKQKPLSYTIDKTEWSREDKKQTYYCFVELEEPGENRSRLERLSFDMVKENEWTPCIDLDSIQFLENPEKLKPNGLMISLSKDTIIQEKLDYFFPGIREKLQPIGEKHESNGICMEVISGYAEGKDTWYLYSLQDVEGRYDYFKPDTWNINDNIGNTDCYSPMPLYYDQAEKKSYHVMHLGHEDAIGTEEQTVTVTQRSINFEKSEWADLTPILKEHKGNVEGIHPTDNVTDRDWDHPEKQLDPKAIWVLDYTKPLDIEVIPGIYVSGIGWIEDQLHVQIRTNNFYAGSIWVSDRLKDASAISRETLYSPLSWWTEGNHYEEYLFNYKPEDAERLSLTLNTTLTRDSLDGVWVVQFPLSSICPDVKAEEPEKADELPATEIQYVSAYPDNLHDYDKYSVWQFFCRWAQGDTNDLPYSFTTEQKTSGEETQRKINELLEKKPLSYKVDKTEWSSADKKRTYYCFIEVEEPGENSSRLEYLAFDLMKENTWTTCIDLDSIQFLGRPEKTETDYQMISLSKEGIINDQMDYFFTGIREKLQPIGKTSECNGIRLEVISGYAEGKETWYLYSLEDLEGKYEEYSADIWDMGDDLKETDTYQPGVLYRDKAANKSYHMMHLTHDGEFGYEERDVKLTLDNVHFSKTVWADLMPLLKEHMEPVEGVHPTADMWDSDWEHRDKQLNPEDYKVLDYTKPLNFEVVPGEFVTGIGWIDNQLHVQIRMADDLAGYSEGIYCNTKGTTGYGKEVPYTPLGWVAGSACYEEYIFNYTPEDIENLSLILNSNISYKSEYGTWSVEFPLSAICPNVKAEEPETEPAEEPITAPAEEQTVSLEMKDGQFILTLDGISYRLNEDGTATIVKIGKEFGEPIEIPENVVLTFNVNNVEYEAFLDYVNKK